MTTFAKACRAGAIGHLADLAAATEVFALELLLLRPPAVTWAVHRESTITKEDFLPGR